MNDLYSPIGDDADAADELPRIPLAAVLGVFSALIFAITGVAAAVIYFLKG